VKINYRPKIDKIKKWCLKSNNNDLEESFQSAYKCFHSSETALLKVQNDILCEKDNHKCVVLLLLDMSAAFDTIYHELLLKRKSKRYRVKGNVLNWFQSYASNQDWI